MQRPTNCMVTVCGGTNRRSWSRVLTSLFRSCERRNCGLSLIGYLVVFSWIFQHKETRPLLHPKSSLSERKGRNASRISGSKCAEFHRFDFKGTKNGAVNELAVRRFSLCYDLWPSLGTSRPSFRWKWPIHCRPSGRQQPSVGGALLGDRAGEICSNQWVTALLLPVGVFFVKE